MKKHNSLRSILNVRKEEREQADRAAFFASDDVNQRYILHKDYVRIADEIKHTRRWLFLILVFTFFAVTQIANFFTR